MKEKTKKWKFLWLLALVLGFVGLFATNEEEAEAYSFNTGSITVSAYMADSADRNSPKTPIVGAQIEIYNVYGTVAMLTTGFNGSATAYNVPDGRYEVVMRYAPPEYQIDIKQGQTFTYILCGEPVSTGFTFIKPKQGTLEIVKTDEAGYPLTGAEFYVYENNGVTNPLAGVITTGSNGIATLTLPYGNYLIRENKAPAGYVLDQTFKYATVGATKATVKVVNKKDPAQSKGAINIVKYNENGTQTLSGAEFRVTNSSGTVMGTVTTNSSGIATINNLPLGYYTITETKAPAGYELSGGSQTANVVNSTNPPTVLFYNKKVQTVYGSIKIVKTDEAGTTLLSGAEFEVRNSSTGALVGAVVTDSKGTATINNLPLTTYIVTETKAPSGYELSSNSQMATLTNSSTMTLTFKNKKSPDPKGELVIIKTDETGSKRLSAAEFKLLNSNNQEVKKGIVTDGNGVARVYDLPYGDYYIVETKAPAGYEIAAERTKVTINAANPMPTVAIKNKQVKDDGKITITKVDESGKPLSGAKFIVLNQSTYRTYEVTSGANGLAELTNMPNGMYLVAEKEAPAGYERDTNEQFDMLDASNRTIRMTFVNKKLAPTKGSLTIDKVDETTGASLAGAEFKLIDKDGKEIKSGIVTDKDGKATVEDLEPGDYYLVETKAPTGYELSTDRIKVTITASKTPVVMTIKNKQVKADGVLTIKKVDEEGRPLAGAKFTVLNQINRQSYEVISGTDGLAKLTNLPNGYYYVAEKEAPAGYEKDNDTQFDVLDASNRAITMTFVNKKLAPAKGSLTINKTDKATGASLARAEFKLTDKDGKEIKSGIVTDKDGKATVEDLEPGDYYLEETKAPDGYELSTERVKVTVTSSKTVTVKIENKQKKDDGTVIINKVDQDGNPVEGAEFVIMNQDTFKIYRETSDAAGLIKLTGMADGLYLIAESEAPAGYEKDNVTQFDVLDASNRVIELTFVNNKITPKNGSLTINKVDEEDETPLAGAEFKLTDKDGKEIKSGIVTDKDGKATVEDLEPGDYYLEETKAPDGYELSDKRHPVEIKEGNDTPVTIENTKIPEKGSLTINKVDEDDKGLEGGRFNVISMSNGKFYDVTSGADGKVTINDLDFGGYLVIEVEAPAGYEKETDFFNVTIDSSNKHAELKVVNKLADDGLGSITIHKVNEEDEPLLWAVFQILDSDKNIVKDGLVTDVDGLVIAPDLPYGDYYIKEVQAPAGYRPITEEIKVTLDKDNKHITQKVVNKAANESGTLHIHVSDNRGNGVFGAQFAIIPLDPTATTFISAVTDANGDAVAEDLKYGEYRVIQMMAPAGYRMDTTLHVVTIGEEAPTLSIENPIMNENG